MGEESSYRLTAQHFIACFSRIPHRTSLASLAVFGRAPRASDTSIPSCLRQYRLYISMDDMDTVSLAICRSTDGHLFCYSCHVAQYLNGRSVTMSLCQSSVGLGTCLQRHRPGPPSLCSRQAHYRRQSSIQSSLFGPPPIYDFLFACCPLRSNLERRIAPRKTSQRKARPRHSEPNIIQASPSRAWANNGSSFRFSYREESRSPPVCLCNQTPQPS